MQEPKVEKHHHHILPVKTIMTIGTALFVLTFVTVWIAGVDLGSLNFVVAVLVASLKASLVALFFMNLWYDKKENGAIFATSFVFLAIFIVLTATDLFFRGDVYVKGQPFSGGAAVAAEQKSKLKEPWLATPELIARGKEQYALQCVSCHGPQGLGNGPAAAALNPPPRNFTATTGWKNGRKPSQIFKTLKEGIPGTSMPAFGSLPSDDRWAITHFVASLNSQPEKDTPADLAKIGVDPNKPGGGEVEVQTIPVDLAMEQIAKTVPTLDAKPVTSGVEMVQPQTAGGKLFVAQCASCHGAKGEGTYRVNNMGVNPKAFVVVRPLTQSESMRSLDAFQKRVIEGLPGNLMPSYGPDRKSVV